jgi:hypothetical protein
MLKHVVMWRFVESAEGKSRKENAQWMKEHLEALVGVVPEIRSMEVGVNCYPGETAYDAVLISTFDDVDAMNRYKVHPAHVAVAEYCKKVRESRVDIDYII